MKNQILLFVVFLVSVANTSESQARVYSNKPVGDYKVSFDLRDYDGTFLNFMKEVIYPALAGEASNISGSRRDFLGAIKRGEGVEIRLSDEVTTLHVKYKNPFDSGNPERSGRSFGLVGRDGRNYKYVADASYAHFLRTLEKLSFGSDKDLEGFYRAIMAILANSDSSHVEGLDTKAQQVAADFVAVYVAEQYRHLINGKDRNGSKDEVGRARLGRGHNWDDAHLQVTLLAAFHGGQSKGMRYMVYEGELTDEVYDQNTCLYRRFDDRDRSKTRKREIELKDYWQFSYRSDCPGRSGVNITRREFEKMGYLINESLRDNFSTPVVERLAKELGRSTRGGMIEKVAQFFVSNRAPSQLQNDGDDLVEAIVDYVMEAHYRANDITGSLIH